MSRPRKFRRRHRGDRPETLRHRPGRVTPDALAQDTPLSVVEVARDRHPTTVAELTEATIERARLLAEEDVLLTPEAIKAQRWRYGAVNPNTVPAGSVPWAWQKVSLLGDYYSNAAARFDDIQRLWDELVAHKAWLVIPEGDPYGTPEAMLKGELGITMPRFHEDLSCRERLFRSTRGHSPAVARRAQLRKELRELRIRIRSLGRMTEGIANVSGRFAEAQHAFCLAFTEVWASARGLAVNGRISGLDSINFTAMDAARARRVPAGSAGESQQGAFRRKEAARYLSISPRNFDINVRSHPLVPNCGTKGAPLFQKKDLDAWLDRKKAGSSARISAPVSYPSGSRTPAAPTNVAREREILRKLRSGRKKSTPTS